MGTAMREADDEAVHVSEKGTSVWTVDPDSGGGSLLKHVDPDAVAVADRLEESVVAICAAALLCLPWTGGLGGPMTPIARRLSVLSRIDLYRLAADTSAGEPSTPAGLFTSE